MYFCARFYYAHHQSTINFNETYITMELIDIMLLCIYAPFALAALWVVGCLFFGRTDLVPKRLARWFGRGEKS